jgi:hypothetical protein
MALLPPLAGFKDPAGTDEDNIFGSDSWDVVESTWDRLFLGGCSTLRPVSQHML